MEMIRVSGQQGVPVTVANGDVILGFDQRKFAKLAEKYAGPKRPPRNPGSGCRRVSRQASGQGRKGSSRDERRLRRQGSNPDRGGARGLKPGDIITSFAGKRVRTMAALDQMVETLKAGDKATAKFIRDGENQSIVLQF